MASAVLQVKDFHAYYGTSHVLQGVSFEVGEECVAILGRNGMGKSTLLRAILGLQPPQRRGTVHFGGQDVSRQQSYLIAGLGLAYVPQGRRLFPSLSVHEHLQITHRQTDGRKDWTPDAVYDLFPELARRRRVSGTRLSGGEQQMLAIGRALVTNPRLLMMDEPSEGLAPVAVQRVLLACKELLRSGMAILLVEQNLKAAQLVADRVLVMVTGRVAHQAPITEFIGDQEAKRKYLAV
jgi:branched-chain amino acid transport system ATP-binding protein